MEQIKPSIKVLDGLRQDPATGDYRVLPGYSQQVLRYGINETWLDEDDGQWISREAVQRKLYLEAHEEPAAA